MRYLALFSFFASPIPINRELPYSPRGHYNNSILDTYLPYPNRYHLSVHVQVSQRRAVLGAGGEGAAVEADDVRRAKDEDAAAEVHLHQ